ncbi:C40 family peptidase [Bergeyella cardium]|uniref:NlpC/P60 family protein n=1 Tax=Bergeyella cardium TaxID=1585976 RepID=A0A6P1QVI6_9FLAO|nr:C40 family peptidase [Bergeyella cardium]QHN65775.1 NlpC/P60 family protein [Bergeyella cardium]WHE33370.1 C40 family peptidase [Bergeyella cardium]WHF60019.1 C40 family peptidase [Bergeyella cardium]
MKQLILTLSILMLVTSCSTTKSARASYKPRYQSSTTRNLTSKFSGKTEKHIRKVLKDAEKYLGTPYRFGGTTSSGFDCSGFTLTVFAENDYTLPRRSSDQSEIGSSISVNHIKPGDLLFFATSGGSRVSHVGIAHSIDESGEIRFIHASTSKGVIISSLSEKYWNKAFLHAKRIF